jgi:hypothetical protein
MTILVVHHKNESILEFACLPLPAGRQGIWILELYSTSIAFNANPFALE